MVKRSYSVAFSDARPSAKRARGVMQVRYPKPRGSAIPSRFKGYARTGGYYGRFGRGGELKFLDTALSFTFDATLEVPATGQLNLIPQGDTQSQRIGRKVIIKSISLKGNMVSVPAAAAVAASTAYMWLVMDTQANGAAATAADANTGVFTTNDAATAQLTLANSSRFRVIKKWAWDFNAPAGVTTAYNRVSKHFNFYKKCSIPIEFDAAATTGAITTIRSNNLFLVAGIGGSLSDDEVQMTGSCRIRYEDA